MKLKPAFNLLLYVGAVKLLAAVIASAYDQSDRRIPLYIGGFFDRTESDGKSGWAQGMEAAAMLALDDINNRSDILPGYVLRIVKNDTKSLSAHAIKSLFWQITNQPTKIMLYGAQNSHVTTAIGEISRWWNLIQVTTSFTPEITDPIRYPYVYTVCPTLNAFDDARLALLKYFSWTRVGMVVLQYDAFITAAVNLKSVLLRNNISVVATETFNENASDAVMVMKKMDIRIVIGFLLDSNTRDIFCEAYKQNMYGHKYVWILQVASEAYWWRVPDSRIECSGKQLLTAANHHFVLHDTFSRLDNKRPISGMDSREFGKKYQDRLKEMDLNDAFIYAGQAYDAMWAIAMTLNYSMTILPVNKSLENFTYEDNEMIDILNNSIRSIYFEGQSGFIKFTERKDSITEFQVSQVQDDNITHLGVYVPENKTFKWNKDPLWPKKNVPYDHKPTFYEEINIKPRLSYSLIGISILGILSSLFFLQFNVRNRNHKYIKMSSPNINNIIIFGCMISYICVIMYNIDLGKVYSSTVSAVVMIRMMFLALSFSICFGGLFSKSWRIYKIFLNKDFKKIVIKDVHLYLMVTGFVVVDIFIFIVWFASDPPLPHKIFSTSFNSHDMENYIIYYVWVASSDHQVKWLISLYAYKGLVLAFGAFLAYETRNVNISAVNDSRQIGISVYCMVTVAITFASTSFFIDTLQVDVKTGLGCFCMLVGTTITLFLVFIPKVKELRKLKKCPQTSESSNESGIKVTVTGHSFGHRSKGSMINSSLRTH